MKKFSAVQNRIIGSRIAKSYLDLSLRDRRLLLLLAVFLLSTGYFQLIFEPAYQKWNFAQTVVSEKKKELRKMEKKIKEMRLLERDMNELMVKMSIISARINMPSAEKELPVVVRSITQAAAESGVTVANIRPIAPAPQDGKELQPMTFSIEGTGRTNEIVTFLEKLWGVKIEELGLSLTEDEEKPVHFFTKITLIPAVEFPASAIKVAPFHVAEDVFWPRGHEFFTTATEEEDLPMTSLPPPPDAPSPLYVEPSVSLSGLRLVGVTQFPGSKFAAIADGAREIIVALGEKVRSYTVSAIDEKGIELSREGEIKGRLDFPPTQVGFPEGPLMLSPPPVMPAQALQQQKKGRLGLKLQNITPEVAKEKNVPVDSGLLVLGARTGEVDVLVNDIITAINGIRTPTMNEAVRVMQLVSAGDNVELSVVRGNLPKKITLKAME